jgi:hypothetical protein
VRRRPGAGPLAVASGATPQRVEEPDPRHADGLRSSVPGIGSVRRRRSPVARGPGAARAVGRRRDRRPAADRGPRTGRSTTPRRHCAGWVPTTPTCRC